MPTRVEGNSMISDIQRVSKTRVGNYQFDDSVYDNFPLRDARIAHL